MKYFYSHLIEIEAIVIKLDKMDLSKEEKLHLTHLIDSSLHHTVLNAILSELSEEDKRLFILHLKENNHDKIWQFLNNKVSGIETKIRKAATDLNKEFMTDLKEAERLQSK